ncbi:MAG: single-stranded DNA-binding protein [Planctomycetota bacterium]
MANFNKVILLGNLTRDPELRYTQSGMPIAKLGMAVNRKYSVQGEQKEDTCFVDLTAFGKQAEVINQYLTKGRSLFVEGRLQFSQWEGQNGDKRSKLEVVIENFQFVGGREGAGGGGGGGGQKAYGGGAPGGAQGGAQGGGSDGPPPEQYDDIPF